MNCYTHPNRPALGICKSCGKGICMDCLTEIENGIACRDQCEERAQLVNWIVDNNSRFIATSNKALKLNAYFLLVVGLLMCLFGYFIRNEPLGWWPFVPGIVLTLLGLSRLKRAALYPTPDKKKAP